MNNLTIALALCSALILSSCATKEEIEKCQLDLPPLSASYRASGATRLHDMRRLSAVNQARDFCVDHEIKIEEDRATNEKERWTCPERLGNTRLIRVSCPKGEVKTSL